MKRLREMAPEDRVARHYPTGLARETLICAACEQHWPCDVAVAITWANPDAATLGVLREKAALYDRIMVGNAESRQKREQ